MALLITYNEAQAIKKFSSNNEDDYAQIMEEVQINELQELLGFELYQDLINNPTSAQNVILLDGTTWTYGSQSIVMKGLKYVLAHYFIAQYAEEIRKKDTFSGYVKHNFDESNQVTENDRHKTEKRARETAAKFWNEVKLYLDNHNDIYTYWNCSESKTVFHPKMRRLTKLHTNSINLVSTNSKRDCCT
jgi:hypothetical protein